MEWPNEASGTDRFVQSFNRLLRKCKEVAIVSTAGNGYRLRPSPSGTALEIIQSSGGGKGLQGPYILQSVQGDYITVFSYDAPNNVVGSSPIYIAKESKHRQSLVSETLWDGVHQYTYQAGPDANNIQRTDTLAGTAEMQRIVPPWVTGATVANAVAINGELIYADITATGLSATDGTKINLLISKRSCQWAKISA